MDEFWPLRQYQIVRYMLLSETIGESKVDGNDSKSSTNKPVTVKIDFR